MDIEEWGYHHGPEEHPVLIALRARLTLPCVVYLSLVWPFAHSVDIVASFPAHPGPHGAQCSVKFGITLVWNFEAADNAQAWLLSQTAPTASTWGTMWNWYARPQREARLSSFKL